MGLDMDLIKRYYIGAEYEWNGVTGSCDISVHGSKLDIDFGKLTNIECNCITWRKANMIHKWFVDNVQGGEDDCKDYYVSRDNLKDLLDICLRVRDNQVLASALLPTQSGFFFGSTEYNEDYFEEINFTIKELSKISLMHGLDDFDYYYTSSW